MYPLVLVEAYEHGTKSNATCRWNDEQECYSGDFYNFLLKLQPYIKKLEIPYKLELFTNIKDKKIHTLYLSIEDKNDAELIYTVIDPAGKIVTDKITKSKLKVDFLLPLDVDKIEPLLPKILNITSSRGHTINIELKSKKTIGKYACEAIAHYHDKIKGKY